MIITRQLVGEMQQVKDALAARSFEINVFLEPYPEWFSLVGSGHIARIKVTDLLPLIVEAEDEVGFWAALRDRRLARPQSTATTRTEPSRGDCERKARLSLADPATQRTQNSARWHHLTISSKVHDGEARANGVPTR